MSKLDIRGFIAPAEYDGDWAQPYIERGLWTPESKVRRDLAAASTDEPLTVRVSSPGGSVFAGYDMANAIRDWARDTGQSVAVEVGALAASMGSYLGFFLSPDVAIHRNTKAMFHGATTMTWGGKEAHEDSAELLAQINGQIKGDLVAKGVAPETVDEWLSEGRMGWLGADQIMEHGMAQTVLDDDAPEYKPEKDVLENAMKAAEAAGKTAIAAALAELEACDGCDEPGDDAGEPEATGSDAPEPTAVIDAPAETEGETDAPAAEPAPDLGAEIDGLSEKLEAATAAIEALTAERDALTAKVEKQVEAHRALQSKFDKVSADNTAKAEALTALREKWDRLTKAASAAPVSTDQTAGTGANSTATKPRPTIGIWQR